MAMLWIGTSDSNLVAMPDPSTLEWGLQDVSAPDAGRTQDANATMYKEYITSKRKLKLAWLNPTMEDAGMVLRAIHHEYFRVRYFDVMAGEFQTRTFYHGDITAPFRWFDLPGREDSRRLTTLSFDVIER